MPLHQLPLVIKQGAVAELAPANAAVTHQHTVFDHHYRIVRRDRAELFRHQCQVIGVHHRRPHLAQKVVALQMEQAAERVIDKIQAVRRVEAADDLGLVFQDGQIALLALVQGLGALGHAVLEFGIGFFKGRPALHQAPGHVLQRRAQVLELHRVHRQVQCGHLPRGLDLPGGLGQLLHRLAEAPCRPVGKPRQQRRHQRQQDGHTAVQPADGLQCHVQGLARYQQPAQTGRCGRWHRHHAREVEIFASVPPRHHLKVAGFGQGGQGRSCQLHRPVRAEHAILVDQHHLQAAGRHRRGGGAVNDILDPGPVHMGRDHALEQTLGAVHGSGVVHEPQRHFAARRAQVPVQQHRFMGIADVSALFASTEPGPLRYVLPVQQIAGGHLDRALRVGDADPGVERVGLPDLLQVAAQPGGIDPRTREHGQLAEQGDFAFALLHALRQRQRNGLAGMDQRLAAEPGEMSAQHLVCNQADGQAGEHSRTAKQQRQPCARCPQPGGPPKCQDHENQFGEV